jgi:hypothetical protein
MKTLDFQTELYLSNLRAELAENVCHDCQTKDPNANCEIKDKTYKGV